MALTPAKSWGLLKATQWAAWLSENVNIDVPNPIVYKLHIRNGQEWRIRTCKGPECTPQLRPDRTRAMAYMAQNIPIGVGSSGSQAVCTPGGGAEGASEAHPPPSWGSMWLGDSCQLRWGRPGLSSGPDSPLPWVFPDPWAWECMGTVVGNKWMSSRPSLSSSLAFHSLAPLAQECSEMAVVEEKVNEGLTLPCVAALRLLLTPQLQSRDQDPELQSAQNWY